MGDVVLSTPAIENVRRWAPEAHIAFMTRPYTREVVEENPFLDEVIIYDKFGKHHGWLATITFALGLRKKKFDLALVLHGTNRAHIICHLAGIPERVGWNRKKGFLLTNRVFYSKREGKKHEIEYVFEIVEAAGIPITSTKLLLSIPEKIQFETKKRLIEYGFTSGFFAIHSGASSPSKKWPIEKFSQLIDFLHEKKKLPFVIVGGTEEEKLGEILVRGRETFVKDCTGILSVSELAALLKESLVLISNDSGPVHVACAVGTPVISIFGRKKTNLGPNVWGPVGDKSVVLQHDVGCPVCLADECEKNFACLEAVRVDEVIESIEHLLTR